MCSWRLLSPPLRGRSRGLSPLERKNHIVKRSSRSRCRFGERGLLFLGFHRFRFSCCRLLRYFGFGCRRPLARYSGFGHCGLLVRCHRFCGWGLCPWLLRTCGHPVSVFSDRPLEDHFHGRRMVGVVTGVRTLDDLENRVTFDRGPQLRIE